MRTIRKVSPLWVAALFIGMVTMSFRAVVPKQQMLVWFEVQNGQIQTDQQAEGGPSGDCQLTENEEICLAAFEESQLIDGEAPTTDPHDSSVQDLAYRAEP